MWNLGIGISEIIVLALVYAFLAMFAGQRHLWTWSILPSVAIGIVLSPADLLSMFVVTIPLIVIVFISFSIRSSLSDKQLLK